MKTRRKSMDYPIISSQELAQTEDCHDNLFKDERIKKLPESTRS